MEEEQTVSKRPYNIMIGDVVYVKRQDVDYKDRELTFYKIQITKGSGDEQEKFYKPAKFRKGVSLENNAKIRLLDFFENCRHLDKYHDEFGLMILEFELVTSEETTIDAINEYKNEVNDSDYDEENVVY